jgi:hypothetical protein
MTSDFGVVIVNNRQRTGGVDGSLLPFALESASTQITTKHVCHSPQPPK